VSRTVDTQGSRRRTTAAAWSSGAGNAPTGIVAPLRTPAGELDLVSIAGRQPRRRPSLQSPRRYPDDRAGGRTRPPARSDRSWAEQAQLFWGKPRLSPPWLGSSQREVTTLPRVKKCTPSIPWAWESPNSEDFQPPKE
jgi:hypothetical protein